MQVTLADAGRFVNQDPIGVIGGANLYAFAPNTNKWLDVLGLNKICPHHTLCEPYLLVLIKSLIPYIRY